MSLIRNPQERKRLIAENARRIRGKQVYEIKLKKVRAGTIVDGTFRPWMRRYAAWLASRPAKATGKEKVQFVRNLIRAPITLGTIRRLEAREDFQKYYEELDADAIKQARADLESAMGEYVDTHLEGMRMAVTAKDYKAIPPYTVPVIDRVYPKREDGAPRANVVVLNFGVDDPRARSLARALDRDTVDAEIVVEELDDKPDQD